MADLQETMSEEEKLRLLELPCEERYKIMNTLEHKKVMSFIFWMRAYLRLHPDIAKREREKQIEYRIDVEHELW